MWQDQPAWGWGGGAYMYLFNTYQEQVPQLRAQIYREQPNLNRFYMVNADSDWVEFLVEYGVVGIALLCATVVSMASALWRWRAWSQGLPLFLGLGAVGIILHGYLDHVLRNPALLLLLSGLLVVAVRLAVPRDLPRRKSNGGEAGR
jgi:O-antigen ligase